MAKYVTESPWAALTDLCSYCIHRWKAKCKKLERDADRAQHSAQQAAERNEQLVKETESLRAAHFWWTPGGSTEARAGGTTRMEGPGRRERVEEGQWGACVYCVHACVCTHVHVDVLVKESNWSNSFLGIQIISIYDVCISDRRAEGFADGFRTRSTRL